MQGQLDFPCGDCGYPVSAVFELSESAEVRVESIKDYMAGLQLDVPCHGCNRRYTAYVVEHEVRLDCRIPQLSEDPVSIRYVKPDFLRYFGTSLEAASATFRRLVVAIDDVRALLAVAVDATRLQSSFHQMLFIQLVSSLEHYLAETLVHEVGLYREASERLLTQDRTLAEEKVSLLAAFTTPMLVEKRLKDYLGGVLFHNLIKASNLYRIAFGKGFSYADDAHKTALMTAMARRHDCVHRNGRTADGVYHPITADYVDQTATHVARLAGPVEERLIAYRTLVRATPPPLRPDFSDDIPF